MWKAYTLMMLLIVVVLPLSAFSTTETWYYYDAWGSYYWNLPADDDYYVQAFDPADFAIGSEDYTITEIGIWASGNYTGEDGSGPCALFLILLPDKESSPEGIPHTYDLTDQTITWEADDDTLNTYEVDWDVDGEQCVGLGIIGEPPYISDYILCMDDGPDDTNDWEYLVDGWYSIEDDFGYYYDFGFQLTVEYTPTAIQPTSLGVVKALFN